MSAVLEGPVTKDTLWEFWRELFPPASIQALIEGKIFSACRIARWIDGSSEAN
jgi:hypothetical protein